MGNSLGSKKTAKVMKITGEEFKLKTPIQAGEVVKDYPGHVLLESEAVKHYGTRAKPLEPNQELKPKRLYFLVELPKVTKEKNPRRVRSAINMSAKDRLENLMLARRSASDLSIMKPAMSIVPEEPEAAEKGDGSSGGGMRVRMRLPRQEVERLMRDSRDEAEAAEKIVNLCLVKNHNINNNNSGEISESTSSGGNGDGIGVVKQQVRWKDGNHGVKANQKRVSFRPINEAVEIPIAVA